MRALRESFDLSEGRVVTGRKPTISDVARCAGVSTATAGRVLGGYGYSSADKRRRVLLAAEELGYRPNHLARSLITGRTQTIGVVTPGIERPSSAALVRGIADIAARAGFGVLLAQSDETVEGEISAVEDLDARGVDGLVLAPFEAGAHLGGVAGQARLVIVDRDAGDLGVDSVTIDRLAAGRDCVRCLLDAGHRAIAVAVEVDPGQDGAVADLVAGLATGELSAPAATMPGGHLLRGYLEAHAERGMRVDPGRVLVLPTRDAIIAQKALLNVLRAEPRPDALVAGNESITRVAIGALARAGTKVPQDLSFVGVEDLDWLRFAAPGLDAIVFPHRGMGQAAARLLLERIEGYSGPPRRLSLAPRQRSCEEAYGRATGG